MLHAPAPSHTADEVAAPSTHVALRQVFPFTQPSHAVRAFPSQRRSPHTLPSGAGLVGHVPWPLAGRSTTGRHTPFVAPPHDSQIPLHAASQHTPSAQCPAPSEPSTHSRASVHDSPSACRVAHDPAAQYPEVAQSASTVQLVEHAGLVPEHRNGAQLPSDVAGNVVHDPLVAPAHVLHGASQAASQQKPLTHATVHSAHGLLAQSATRSHAAPIALRGAQTFPFVQ